MEKTPEEIRQEYDALQEKSYLIRGKIIGKVIEFESLIERYIATYFFPDGSANLKFREFKLFIFSSDKMSMSGKKEILLQILDSHFKDWKKKYPKFPEYVDNIIEIRNILAHHPILAIALGEDPTGVTFVKAKNRHSFNTLNDETLQDVITKIEYCKEMMTIYTIIHFDIGERKSAVIMVEPQTPILNKAIKKL